jgi:Icc-related predicted phosphoesterase
MKILSVSDKVEKDLLVSSPACLPARPDIILACGDLPPEYLSQLRECHNVPLYYVQGNHDIRYHTSPPVGCTDIHAQIVTEKGLRIMGFGGSRWYNGGENQYSEAEMKKFIRSLWFQLLQSSAVDLIISHAPPRFINDREDPCHKGFRCFVSLLKKHKPAWFIHGHIHTLFNNPAERIMRVCETQVLNSYGFFFFETELVEEETTGKRYTGQQNGL